MLNFVKLPIILSALFLYGYVPMVSGNASIDSKLVSTLEDSLPQLAFVEDHRAASNAALQLASARSRLGDTAGACAALGQSLEQYRKAVAKESGVSEAAISSVNDDSDGMEVVRAKYGCTRV